MRVIGSCRFSVSDRLGAGTRFDVPPAGVQATAGLADTEPSRIGGNTGGTTSGPMVGRPAGASGTSTLCARSVAVAVTASIRRSAEVIPRSSPAPLPRQPQHASASDAVLPAAVVELLGRALVSQPATRVLALLRCD